MALTFNQEPVSSEMVAEPWDDARPRFRQPRWSLDLAFRRTPLVRFFMGFSIVIALFALAWPFLPRRYEATATIVVLPTDPESGSDTAQLLKQPLDENAVQSEIDQISSPVLAGTVLARQHLAEDAEFNGGWKRWIGLGAVTEADLRRRLLDHFVLSKGRRSYTVTFGFRSSDPAKAAVLTQSLLDAYLAEQTARKRKAVDGLTGLLTERVNELRTRSEASQQALESFLVKSGLIDTGATISLERELQTLSTEAALARSQAAEAQARADALAALQKSGRVDSAPEVLASPVIQRYKEKMAGAKSVVSPVDIPQRAIDEQIALEADRIVRSVKTQAATAREREAALERAISSIREEMTQRQRSELQLVALRHDAEADRKALDSALVRLAGQAARANGVVPHVTLIAPPEVPTRPIFPNPLLTALAAVIAGCLAGAAMVFAPAAPVGQWVRRLATR